MIRKWLHTQLAALLLVLLSIAAYMLFQYSYEIWLAKQILNQEGSFQAAMKPKKYVHVIGLVSGKETDDVFISTIVSNGSTNASGAHQNGCFILRSIGPKATFSFYAPKSKKASRDLLPGFYFLNVSLAPKDGESNSSISISDLSLLKYIQEMQRCHSSS